MKTLDLIQGSPSWMAHRATARNASDVPAVLDCSPYTTRAQLLHARHTGLRPEVDAPTQHRFDAGHAIEQAQLPGAEEIIGSDLYPAVGVETIDGIELSASFDGITMDESTAYECKTLNADLRAAFADMETIAPEHRERGAGKCLPKHYRAQLEQQLMVSGADRVLFVAANAEGSDVLWCWYTSDPALRAEILAAWRQFDADLAAYVPTEAVQRVEAAPIEALPAVSVRMDGALAVHSNLDVFGAKLRAFVAGIPAKPSTEEDFANAEAACKALKKAEDALDGAEANALGQVQSVETLTRTIGDLRAVARTARLATEKMVKARKDQIRIEQVQRGKDALAAHIAGLNQQIGKNYMPAIPADFAGAISGKKNVDSLANAIDSELARAKIAANEVAGRIQVNLNWLREHADKHKFLFVDVATLVLDQPDAMQAKAQLRINEHDAAEQRRLDAERERIRQEEQAKAEKEAREKFEREQNEQIARDREAARQAAEAAKPAQPPAAPAIAAPASFETVAAANSPIPASNVSTLRQVQPTAVPTMKLGDINSRLQHFAVNEAGLAALGFPATQAKGAKLYHEQDFPRIVDSMVAHLRMVAAEALEAA